MLVKIVNAGLKMGQAGTGKERIRHMKVRKEKTLATKMAISLVAGLTAGLLFLFLREHLNASGQEAVWATINNLLFQDITAAGASSALGLFYLAGQMFIRSLQLVIVPMVFTSITLAIGQISDTSTLGRISFKCIKGFLICSFFALLLACVCGIVFYNMGVFHIAVDGLESVSGSTGSNPLLVVLNVIPSNIASTFSSNTAVLAVVFLAIALGLCMKTLGEEKTATLRKLIQELNDVVIVFLNFVVSKFGPVGYGKTGSFEGFCSGGGIRQLAQSAVKERIQRGEKVAWCPDGDLDGINARTVAEAAADGDELAREVYRTSARMLGVGLSVVIDILNPEMIVIGSIYARNEAMMKPVMEEVIAREALGLSGKVCRIVPAALGEKIGDYAALSVAADIRRADNSDAGLKNF